MKDAENIENILSEKFETTGKAVAYAALKFAEFLDRGARGKEVVQLLEIDGTIEINALRYFMYIGANELLLKIQEA